MRRRCLVLDHKPDIAESKATVLRASSKHRLVGANRPVNERGAQHNMIERSDHWPRPLHPIRFKFAL
jgi:hypothetical protein